MGTEDKEAMVAQMDAAAKEAKAELDQLKKWTPAAVGAWMGKWYLKAGYKRLAKVIRAYAPKEEAPSEDK